MNRSQLYEFLRTILEEEGLVREDLYTLLQTIIRRYGDFDGDYNREEVLLMMNLRDLLEKSQENK